LDKTNYNKMNKKKIACDFL